MPTPTPSRDELIAWDRQHVWHAFTQMAEYEPLLFERGQGCLLYDIDGREYIDGVSSLWCNVHGHAHPKLNAAIREQSDRIAHATLLGASNPTAVRLARRLVEVSPEGLNHVFFSDSGATAVEVALKMAFQYWRQVEPARPEKTLFITLGDAYHGDTIGSVSLGGVDRFSAMFKPLLFDVVRVPAPDPRRRPEGVAADQAMGHYLKCAETILAEFHDRAAAFVLEPLVQCAAGMIVHPPGYLAGIRELTRRFGLPLIADEVAVGFGRTGKLFACEHEQVAPDLLCLAKGLTGGYLPMAATLATDEIWNAFLGKTSDAKQLFHGHTYCGNALASAVALASLEIFEEEQVLERLPEKIAKLSQRLDEVRDLPQVLEIRQRGMIVGIELALDVSREVPYPTVERRGWQVCMEARKRGVFLRPLGDVIVVMPPLAISLDELDRLMDVIRASIRTLSDPK